MSTLREIAERKQLRREVDELSKLASWQTSAIKQLSDQIAALEAQLLDRTNAHVVDEPFAPPPVPTALKGYPQLSTPEPDEEDRVFAEELESESVDPQWQSPPTPAEESF